MDNSFYTVYSDRLGSNGSVKLENNVMLNRRPDGVAITLHNTDILTFTQDGKVILRANGWRTKITLAKLNAYLPKGVVVSQHNGEWEVQVGDESSLRVPFEDGMVVNL